MNISKVPFTLSYELRQLKERLEEIQRCLDSFPSENHDVVDIRFIRYRQEHMAICEEIKMIEELMAC